ncbi:hypothetical protein ACFLWX_03960 [Chloroflexota bacterium]
MTTVDSLRFIVSGHNILYSPRSIAPTNFLSVYHTGGQTPAPLFLAPNLAVRYGIIRLAESHHTSYGFGQDGRGTML